MDVNVDQAGANDAARRVELVRHRRAQAVEAVRDRAECGDPAIRDDDVRDAVESGRGIDDPPARG